MNHNLLSSYEKVGQRVRKKIEFCKQYENVSLSRSLLPSASHMSSFRLEHEAIRDHEGDGRWREVRTGTWRDTEPDN